MLVALQERTVGYTFFLRKHDTTNETAETHDSSSLFCFFFLELLSHHPHQSPIIPMIKKPGLKWMPPHAFRRRSHWMPCFTWSYLLWRLGGPTFPTKTRKHLEDFDGRWVWLPKTMTFEEVEKRDGNESLQRSQRTAC